MLPLSHEIARAATRRHFFQNCGVGLGAMALGSLLAGERPAAAADDANPLRPRQPPLPARAKHVIYLHMAGSPSQLDLFDHKPALKKYDGRPCPKEYLEGKRFASSAACRTCWLRPSRFRSTGRRGSS
jgi:hypothetical protein